MNIVVIDGQGGGIGKQVVAALHKNHPELSILAVGTNSMATLNMLKAGADRGATGENAVLVACRKADILIGPIGIVIADALCGEITPKMAAAVGQSNASRYLIPVNQCDHHVVGTRNLKISDLIRELMTELEEHLA